MVPEFVPAVRGIRIFYTRFDVRIERELTVYYWYRLTGDYSVRNRLEPTDFRRELSSDFRFSCTPPLTVGNLIAFRTRYVINQRGSAFRTLFPTTAVTKRRDAANVDRKRQNDWRERRGGRDDVRRSNVYKLFRSPVIARHDERITFIYISGGPPPRATNNTARLCNTSRVLSGQRRNNNVRNALRNFRTS